MIRLSHAIPAVAAVLVLSACTSGAPAGVTLPALTTTTAVSDSTNNGPGTTVATTPPVTNEPTTAESAPSQPSTAAPVDVTVPPEASALPLPTEQVNIPADSAQEEADRAAIEAVWRQAWELVDSGYDMSATQIEDMSSQLLADPVKTQIVDGLASSKTRNVASYGAINVHPFWYEPVMGREYAVMGDCADHSQFGEIDRSTGTELTRGSKDLSRVGHFVRLDDGSWRLWQVTTMKDQACNAP